MENKKTLVIGASTNPVRYSNLAIQSLRRHKNDVVALAKRMGKVADVEFVNSFPSQKENIHTVTMYVGPQNQPEFVDPILSLHPERVIFNPGTENVEFSQKLREKGIEAIEACTLVLLSTGQY
ncbi:CoA-binding protein [Maribellus comscasis]|uniref:CoA-binding protein n=1 Tax=Maribellus comscasis TaxID=2681766 RepID=A0A6I6JW29_9BACT|nr:CoA-binding protein [Maribellus comscasis]QGY45330.1 CoA-binding protein [Maribellus comscasis]